MLRGEYLGRSHQCRLHAASDSYIYRRRRDRGLAAADVSRQQPTHRLLLCKVGGYLGNRAPLCAGQREAELCGQRRYVIVKKRRSELFAVVVVRR